MCRDECRNGGAELLFYGLFIAGRACDAVNIADSVRRQIPRHPHNERSGARLHYQRLSVAVNLASAAELRTQISRGPRIKPAASVKRVRRRYAS